MSSSGMCFCGLIIARIRYFIFTIVCKARLSIEQALITPKAHETTFIYKHHPRHHPLILRHVLRSFDMGSEVDSGALEYKILVLGSTQVGKTSLIRKYTTGKFPSGMMATVGK